MRRVISFLILATVFSPIGRAADSTSQKVRAFELFEWGASIGYGFVNEDLPEGNYAPILLMGHLEFYLHRRNRDPESRHFFLLYGEPQVNPVFVGGGIRAWEGGMNIGFRYLIRIREINGLHFHAGSGPYYISLDSPTHQSGGFNFGSSFGMVYERLLRDDVKMTVGYRYRHVSNLNLRLPNDGLDNHFFTIGFKKDFPHRAQKRRQRKSAATIDLP